MPPLISAALVVFLEGLSFGIVLPVLTPFAEELHGSETWAGILFAAATLPRVVCAPMWGKLSDHWGRRPTMAVVVVGTTSASVLWALTTTLDGFLMSGLMWLLVARTLYGLFAAQSVLGLAVASDVSDASKRAAAMGVLGAAFGLAFTLGPAIGGYFAEHFGSVNIGWLAGAVQFSSIFIILGLLRETRPDTLAEAEAHDVFARPKSLLNLAAVPVVFWLMLVCIIATASYSLMFPTVQPLSEMWYGWDKGDVGLALSFFGLLGAFVQGGMIRPTVKRLGEKTTAMMGLVMLAAGMGWLATHPAGTGGLWGSLSLMALGTGFCVPTITGLMSLSVHERDQGAVHGLNQSATAVGRTFGFGLSGALFEHVSAAATYTTGGIGAALSLLMLLVLKRPAKTHAVEVEPESSAPGSDV